MDKGLPDSSQRRISFEDADYSEDLIDTEESGPVQSKKSAKFENPEFRLQAKETGEHTKAIQSEWITSIDLTYMMLKNVHEELDDISNALDEIIKKLDKIIDNKNDLNKIRAVQQSMQDAAEGADQQISSFKKKIISKLKEAEKHINQIDQNIFSRMESKDAIKLKNNFEKIQKLSSNFDEPDSNASVYETLNGPGVNLESKPKIKKKNVDLGSKENELSSKVKKTKKTSVNDEIERSHIFDIKKGKKKHAEEEEVYDSATSGITSKSNVPSKFDINSLDQLQSTLAALYSNFIKQCKRNEQKEVFALCAKILNLELEIREGVNSCLAEYKGNNHEFAKIKSIVNYTKTCIEDMIYNLKELGPKLNTSTDANTINNLKKNLNNSLEHFTKLERKLKD